METMTEGVTSVKMISRNDHGAPLGSGKTPTTTNIYNWEQDDNQYESEPVSLHEEELLCNQTDVGSRTSIIVKFKGDIDITITPLLLETLQR